jgi:hypothetical protein
MGLNGSMPMMAPFCTCGARGKLVMAAGLG